MNHTRQLGMTLIELLVSIAILAILSTLSFRAVTQAIKSQEQLEASNALWQALARAFVRVETDIEQLGVRQVIPETPDGLPSLRSERDSTGKTQIIFWRMDSQNGARLAGFEFDGHTFYMKRWPTGNINEAPVRDVLLHGVRRVDWYFLSEHEQQWHASWPPVKTRYGEAPVAVRLEVEHENVGRITRVFAVR